MLTLRTEYVKIKENTEIGGHQMNFKSLKVGDKVYVATTSTHSWEEKTGYDGEVIKIGRKYVTVKFDTWRKYEFRLDNGFEKSEYSPTFCIYPSKKDYEDEQKSRVISRSLQVYLSQHKIPLSALIEAANAVGMEVEE